MAAPQCMASPTKQPLARQNASVARTAGDQQGIGHCGFQCVRLCLRNGKRQHRCICAGPIVEAGCDGFLIDIGLSCFKVVTSAFQNLAAPPRLAPKHEPHAGMRCVSEKKWKVKGKQQGSTCTSGRCEDSWYSIPTLATIARKA